MHLTESVGRIHVGETKLYHCLYHCLYHYCTIACVCISSF
jgi:hypothetical protein